MNRTEKKCLLGSTLLHGALVTVVVLSSVGFMQRQPEDMVTVELIDPRLLPPLTDGSTTGTPPPAAATPEPVREPAPQPRPSPPPAQTPPPQPRPAPVETPRPQPTTTQPPPRSTARNELPTPTPTRRPEMSPVTPARNPTPTPRPAEPPKRTINLANTVTRDTAAVREQQERTRREAAERQARELEDRRRRELAQGIRSSLTTLKTSASGLTSIQMSGPATGGAAALNYGQYVLATFEAAWVTPRNIADDSLVAKAEVVIGSDGTVVSRRLVDRSGDRALDKSVEDALNRVRQVKGFPEGARDGNRTYIIEFNLKARRGNG